VAAITADFIDTISAADVEAAVDAIEDRVKLVHPEIVLLLIKPQGGTRLGRARRPALWNFRESRGDVQAPSETD